MTVFLRYKLRTFRVPEKPVSNPRHFHKLIKRIGSLKIILEHQTPNILVPELATAS